VAPKLAFLIIGHPDYPNDVAQPIAARCVERLRAEGVTVAFDDQPAVLPWEAARHAREALKREVDGVFLFLGTWIEGPTALAAIREFEHLPFAVWAFPMFEQGGRRESTGSFVSYAVLHGALERMGYRAKWLLGMPEHDETVASAVAFAHAAHAVERLKRARVGLIGYAAMGMYPGTFDHALLRRHIGPEVEQWDTYSLVHGAEYVAQREPERIAGVVAELRRLASIAEGVSDADLAKAAGLALALQDLAAERRLDAVNVKCQYELSQQYRMTACLPTSLLADRGVVASCEGDVLVTVTQLLLAAVTDQVTSYGDILDLQRKRMLLSSCGFAPFSLADDPAGRCIRPFTHPGFSGLMSSLVLRRGQVTFARLVEGRGDYRLLYGTGTGVETELRQGCFPALQVELDGDPDRLLSTLASQHLALCYGDITESLEDVCRWWGVEAVRV